MRLRLLAAMGILACPLGAADFLAEPATILHFRLAPRWSASLYTRGRYNFDRDRWADASVSPGVRYRIHRSVSLLGAFFITSYQFVPGRRTMIYRPFAAVEPEFRLGGATLAARTRVERFFITGRLPDYNRYRQRLRVSGRGPWNPFAFAELFFTAHGFTRTRYAAGIVHKLHRRHEIEFSYYYERSRFTGQALRHIFRTVVHLHFGGPQEGE